MPVDTGRPRPVLAVLHQFGEPERERVGQALSAFYDIVFCTSPTDPACSEAVANAKVILARSVSRELLEKASNVELIQTPGTGVDELDLQAISDRGIKIANSHSAALYVAEHAVALLLSTMKNIAVFDHQMRTGTVDATMRSESLYDKTVGIAGFGHVGRAVARMLSGFGVQLVACRRNPESSTTPDSAVRFVGFDELLHEVNVLLICLPLTKQTRGLIGKEEIEQLGKGAYLVNVGRAEILDRSALVNAVAGGHLAGVALDVWWPDEDPPPELTNSDRIVLSPHRAGSDFSGPTYLDGAIESLCQYGSGQQLDNLVDPARGY